PPSQNAIWLDYLPGRARCLPAPSSPPQREYGSAAVEHVVAEILHLEDRGIGPTLDGLRQMRLSDLADDNVVVALLDAAGDLAFDRGQRRIKDRRAVGALVDRLAAELAV